MPNDVGFEPFGWPTVAAARDFYEHPGDPVARGAGTPVSDSVPT